MANINSNQDFEPSQKLDESQRELPTPGPRLTINKFSRFQKYNLHPAKLSRIHS